MKEVLFGDYVSTESFQHEMERGARTNGVFVGRAKGLVAWINPTEDETFLNILGGGRGQRKELLIITVHATYQAHEGLLSFKPRWWVQHRDLREVRAVRGTTPGGYVVDSVRLETMDEHVFTFDAGFHSSMYQEEVSREIAAQNATLAVEEINRAAGFVKQPPPPPEMAPPPPEAPSPAAPETSQAFPISFDPRGPEVAAEAAQAAYLRHQWFEALLLYVKAVDRLHDFYVFEEFRNRQPSPADTWIVQGVTKALAAARDAEPRLNVTEPVREVAHRLRTIAGAVERSGGNPILYVTVLQEVDELVSDVDL